MVQEPMVQWTGRAGHFPPLSAAGRLPEPTGLTVKLVHFYSSHANPISYSTGTHGWIISQIRRLTLGVNIHFCFCHFNKVRVKVLVVNCSSVG